VPEPDSRPLALTLPDELLDEIAERAAGKLLELQAAPEPWVGVDEAAHHLGCKPHRIYSLVHRKAVPFRKDGSRLLFRLSQLDVWLERDAAA
jgi:excisionase family DNA binding protein